MRRSIFLLTIGFIGCGPESTYEDEIAAIRTELTVIQGQKDEIAAIRAELTVIQGQKEAFKPQSFLAPGTKIEMYVKKDTLFCGLRFNYPLWLDVTAVSLNDSGLTFSKTDAVLHTVDFDGKDSFGQPSSFGDIYGLYKRVKGRSAALPCDGDSWIPLANIETFTVLPPPTVTPPASVE